jgi:hypothetical protein
MKKIKDGPFVLYHDNGKIKAKGHIKDNRLYGHYSSYFENGNLKGEGFFENGKLNGICKFSSEDGKVKHEQKYVDGVNISLQEHDERKIADGLDFQSDNEIGDDFYNDWHYELYPDEFDSPWDYEDQKNPDNTLEWMDGVDTLVRNEESDEWRHPTQEEIDNRED